MVLSSYVTVDGWLTAFRISQKPIASFFRQLTKTKTNPKKVFGFWFGSTALVVLKGTTMVACLKVTRFVMLINFSGYQISLYRWLIWISLKSSYYRVLLTSLIKKLGETRNKVLALTTNPEIGKFWLQVLLHVASITFHIREQLWEYSSANKNSLVSPK